MLLIFVVLRSEQRRLERIFAPILALSCSSNTPSTPDATMMIDARDPVDAGLDASAPDASGDAVDPCTPKPVMVDAGPLPEGGIECSYFFQYGCGFRKDVVPRSNCYFSINDCEKMCPDPLFNCHAFGAWCDDGGLVEDANVPVILECVWCPGGVGRRPAGLSLEEEKRDGRSVASGPVGAWLARAAHLEAASIAAFRTLRRELAHHRAPRALLRESARAERDEARHARVMSRLARLEGAVPAAVRLREPSASRTLEAIAIENAIEGCVRETYGALVASWQARNANDRAIARAMRGIAIDETRHAALAWSTARWMETVLDRAARSRMRSAMRDACPTPIDLHPDLVRRAGLPQANIQRAMIDGLREVWS